MTQEAADRKTGLTFVLVRAGETDFARTRRLEGDIDVPLTTRGRSGSRKILEDVLLPMGGVDAVYSARNQGSRETAEIIAEANSNRVRLLNGLNGVSFGLWEGQLVADVQHRHGRIWERWMRDPLSISPPEGEEMSGAWNRTGGALRTIRRKHRQGKVAVVAPETVISLVYCHLAGMRANEVFRVSRQLGGVEILPAVPEATGG